MDTDYSMLYSLDNGNDRHFNAPNIQLEILPIF